MKIIGDFMKNMLFIIIFTFSIAFSAFITHEPSGWSFRNSIETVYFIFETISTANGEETCADSSVAESLLRASCSSSDSFTLDSLPDSNAPSPALT